MLMAAVRQHPRDTSKLLICISCMHADRYKDRQQPIPTRSP